MSDSNSTKHCLVCGKVLNTRQKKCCSRSCSAKLGISQPVQILGGGKAAKELMQRDMSVSIVPTIQVVVLQVMSMNTAL